MPYWKLFYHAVWTTKYRQPLIDPAWELRLYEHMWTKARSMECYPRALGGTQDHVHLLISVPPRLSIATVIGQLKGASSHAVNQDFGLAYPFAWQTEYSVFSVSEQTLGTIEKYVLNQKRHHRNARIDHLLEPMETE